MQLDFLVPDLAVHGDDDLALLGELHRVGQQVEQDLAQSAQVADDRGRQIVLQLVGELDALGGGRGHDHVERALDALGEAEGLVDEVDLARLDLREVEDVVDDRQQRVA